MDRYSARIIQIVKYISYLIAFTLVMMGNEKELLTVGIVSASLIVMITARIFFFTEKAEYKHFGRVMPLFDLALIYWLTLIDQSGASLVFLVVLVCDSAIMMKGQDSAIIAGLSFMTYAIALYYKHDTEVNTLWTIIWMILIPVLYALLILVFFYGISFLIKQLITQREMIKKSAEELEIESEKLEKAYEKLKHSAEQIEELAMVAERNRIAREIHDTVGHTLTTVLVEIEAGKRLLLKGRDEGYTKLELAQEQVRKGLNDIRSSVRLLKKGTQIMDYIKSIELLISETETHTDIKIEFRNFLEDSDIPDEYGKILYNTIQESLTNAIKHGQADSVDIEVAVNGDVVTLMFEDDGVGNNKIVMGFGLTAIRDRVEEVGGAVEYISKDTGGFTIKLEIPLEIGGEND